MSDADSSGFILGERQSGSVRRRQMALADTNNKARRKRKCDSSVKITSRKSPFPAPWTATWTSTGMRRRCQWRRAGAGAGRRGEGRRIRTCLPLSHPLRAHVPKARWEGPYLCGFALFFPFFHGREALRLHYGDRESQVDSWIWCISLMCISSFLEWVMVIISVKHLLFWRQNECNNQYVLLRATHSSEYHVKAKTNKPPYPLHEHFLATHKNHDL